MSAFPDSLSALLAPQAYPHAVERVDLVETHVSWVLLAGAFAYKLKRPVCYPFVDMRAPEQRHFLCREELRLNRRFAPDLYVDVVPITSEAGGARIGGAGEVLEYAVRMRRFDRSQELDQLLARHEVEPRELGAFGASLATIHAHLPATSAGEDAGRFSRVRDSLLQNLQQFKGLSARIERAADYEGLHQALSGLLEGASRLIEARHAKGRVRECHGDLHCRNVVRAAGRLVAFDSLEFQPLFRWIDVAEEIAFLFMDLMRRASAVHAIAFLNGYLTEGGDYEAARLVHLYGAHRALVRAKVAAIEVDAAAASAERDEARADHSAYLSCARAFLSPHRPCLILMSGFSGSGKTWLAQRLAGTLQAIHLRSDLERKRLAGLGALSHSGSAVGQGLYVQEIDQRTYRRLQECAEDVLRGGFSTIVDATFQRRADRTRFISLAAALGLTLVLVRCRAPREVLRERILNRQQGSRDASEATLQVLESQQAGFEAIDPSESLTVIDADTTRSGIVAETEAALAACCVQRSARS